MDKKKGKTLLDRKFYVLGLLVFCLSLSFSPCRFSCMFFIALIVLHMETSRFSIAEKMMLKQLIVMKVNYNFLLI